MPGPSNKKGAQRTKGNVKPSSSSQAAELLAAAGSGTFSTGFIGFGSASGAAAFVPVSQALEDEDSGLDPVFRVTLRKLSKRDAVTKLKALQEFSSLCTDSEEEVVKAALPFWPKIYNKVSMDVDHKVREASQQAMASLASRMRRNLAPHLKSIMGCWLLSQCDTYPTVATAAQQAFSAAFPPVKQNDAVVYCKAEIAEFLLDNLTVQIPSTLSDPKSSSPEDMEMKYNRVMTSSLLAWRKLLETLATSSPDSHGSVPGTLEKLLNSPKLWKFSKSSVTAIKAAFYSFVSGVCQCQTDVAVKFTSKLSPLALHNIDESDSVVCGPLWEAVLSVITYLPECWKYASGQKAFLPKLRKLLQNGCHGNATIVGPNVLPLWSKIPVETCGSKERLLEELFENLKQGLCTDQLRSSPSECGALVRAFMECAQYTVKEALGDSDDNTSYFILIDQVLPIVAASLVDDNSALARSPLYDMIGQLLRSLNQSEYSSTSASTSVQTFVQELKTLILETVKELTENDMFSLEERLSWLIRAIIEPKLTNVSESRLQSQKSVKFSLSDNEMKANTRVSLPSLEKLEVNGAVREIVTEVCLTSFTQAKCQKCPLCLGLFKVIVTTFPDPQLLRTLLQACTLETEDSGTLLLADNTDMITDPVLSFLYLLCLPWIVQIEGTVSLSDTSVSISIGHLLDISLTLLSQLVKTDILHVLSSLLRGLSSTKLFQLLVNKCLMWRTQIPVITEWFHDAELGERLVSLTQSVCQKSLVAMETSDIEVEDQWKLITSVLSSADGEESTLSPRVIEKILGQIEQTLLSLEKSSTGNRLETAIQFVTDVMLKFFCSLKGCLLVPSAESLLLTLFSLSLDEALVVSESCSKRLEDSWRCGVQALVQQREGLIEDTGFLSSACQDINTQLCHKVTSLPSLNKVYHIIQVLLMTVRENLPQSDLSDPTLQSLLDKMTFVTSDRQIPVEILQYLSVVGNMLSADSVRLSNQTDISVSMLPGVIYPALCSARLLLYSKIGEFPNAIPKASSSPDVVKVDKETPKYEWDDKDVDKLHRIVQDLTLSEIWNDAWRSKTCHFEDEIKEVERLVLNFMSGTELKHQNSLLNLALDTSDCEGWIASKCFGRLVSILTKLYPETEFCLPGLIDRYSTLTCNNVQSLQALAPYLSAAERMQMSEIMVARVVSSSPDKLTNIDGTVGALAVVRVFVHGVESDTAVTELLTGLIGQLLAWRQESAVALTSLESSATLTFNLEVIKLLTCVMEFFEVLTDTCWDYVLCSMIGWLQNVEDNQASLLSGEFPAQQLCIACCLLLAKVAGCIQSNSGEDSSALPANLSTEWEEFFSEGSYRILLPLFLKLTGSAVYKDCIGVKYVVLSSVSHALSFCPKEQVMSHHLPAYLIPDQAGSLSDSLQTLLNHLCPVLMLHNRSQQIAAYRILDKIIGDIPKLDSAEDTVAKANEEEETRSPPVSLMKVLLDATAALEVILQDVEVDECLNVPPRTEEFNFILGYLFTWKLLLNFFQHAPSEVRPQYAAYLKETGTVRNLLNNIFRLMPDYPVLSTSKTGKSKDNMFEIEPVLSALQAGDKRELQHVTCSVYRDVLEIMPAIARQWWKDQDRKTSAYVDRFSTKYVSPCLCTREIQTVQNTDVKLDNITVKARAVSREVIATYDLEEVKTEIVIALPPNYPLGNITVTSEKRVGVSASQWDKWLLQLNIFLQHQNGSIVDGLQMWKRNIDKRFEGVEECTICYSVIHGTTLQLPRLQCRTCKKKFHSACLYKWFNTSHNSTCPLCRNLF